MNGYRRELKYIVGDNVLTDIRNRIFPLMRRDEHQTMDHYGIRSVYFDSPDLICLQQNLAGVSTREKYRIRTYDCSPDTIFAEIKIRHRDTISKMSTRIDRELSEVLVSGDTASAAAAIEKFISKKSTGDRVLEKYLARLVTGMYRATVIVGYERSAYVYDIGNVRITLDRNVFSSREFDRMFDPALTGRPALDCNKHILEIKYDEFLPQEITDILGGMGLVRMSSSKYAMCMGDGY